MKSIFVSIGLLCAVPQLSFAVEGFSTGVVARPCPSDVLSCKLERLAYAQGNHTRTLLETAKASFSGVNDDEPSIPPPYCSLRVSLGKGTVLYTVSLNDDDNQANMYAQNAKRLGTILPGEASFHVVHGKPFYYRRNSELVTCTLDK